MKPATISVLIHIYHYLLCLYPVDFRDEFGEEMKAVFAMAVDEAARLRNRSITVVWLREVRDLPVSLAYQYWFVFNKGGSKMTTAYKSPERFFIPGWVVASTIGIPIAFVITLAIVSIIEGIIGGTMQVGDHSSPTEDVYPMYIFVPLLGLLTGFFQWLLLRRYLSRIGWWILATFLGLLLATAILFVTYTSIFQSVSRDSVRVLGLTFIVIGGSMGFTQWLTLRKRINKAWWWILANVVGWILLGLANGRSIRGGLEIAAFALIPGAVTGFALWLLLGQSKRGGLNEQAIIEKQNPDAKDTDLKSPGLQRHAQADLIGIPGSMIRP